MSCFLHRDMSLSKNRYTLLYCFHILWNLSNISNALITTQIPKSNCTTKGRVCLPPICFNGHAVWVMWWMSFWHSLAIHRFGYFGMRMCCLEHMKKQKWPKRKTQSNPNMTKLILLLISLWWSTGNFLILERIYLGGDLDVVSVTQESLYLTCLWVTSLRHFRHY